MTQMEEILRAYTRGEASLEETNAALKKAGAGLRLDPQRCRIAPEEGAVLNEKGQPEGWGLLDTGTGSMEKVEIRDGRLEQPVNQVLPDGSVNMTAFVLAGGRRYAVRGDELTEA